MTVRTKPPVLPVWAETATDNIQPSNSQIQTGWPLSPIPPSRGRFNWFMNLVGNAVAYFLQWGIPQWDSAETYPIGGCVQFNGLTYKALLANTNEEPDTSPTNWVRWGWTQTELDTRIRGHQLQITTVTAAAGQTAFNAPHTQGATWVTRQGLDVAFTDTSPTVITLTIAANLNDVVIVRSL